MTCENCGKPCEKLYGKTKYNGNKDTRMMCLKCYEKEHGEEFGEK